MTDLLKLAEGWERQARKVRATEASSEYEAYWRGYATALEECSEEIRARSEAAAVGGR